MRDTDRDWEAFASTEPYWATFTTEQFRRANLDEDNRKVFFETGEGTVRHVIDLLQRHFGGPDRFENALEFGCGVGRLLTALALRSRTAIGVDVAPSMLQECGRNAAALGAENIILRRSDDALSQVQDFAGKIDLLVSFAVLQHVPACRGMGMLSRLLDLMQPAAYGAIQLVVGPDRPEPDSPLPTMEVNSYPLNDVIGMLYAKGFREMFCETEQHDEFVRVDIYFQRGNVPHGTA